MNTYMPPAHITSVRNRSKTLTRKLTYTNATYSSARTRNKGKHLYEVLESSSSDFFSLAPVDSAAAFSFLSDLSPSFDVQITLGSETAGDESSLHSFLSGSTKRAAALRAIRFCNSSMPSSSLGIFSCSRRCRVSHDSFFVSSSTQVLSLSAEPLRISMYSAYRHWLFAIVNSNSTYADCIVAESDGRDFPLEQSSDLGSIATCGSNFFR